MASSGDWRFAHREGFLNWTVPALPSGGQRLYSKLTPSMLVGQLQRDDIAPADYVMLTEVQSVTLRANAVQIDRSAGGDSVLIVADTTADAKEWYDSLLLATRDQSQQLQVSAQLDSSAMSATAPPPSHPTSQALGSRSAWSQQPTAQAPTYSQPEPTAMAATPTRSDPDGFMRMDAGGRSYSGDQGTAAAAVPPMYRAAMPAYAGGDSAAAANPLPGRQPQLPPQGAGGLPGLHSVASAQQQHQHQQPSPRPLPSSSSGGGGGYRPLSLDGQLEAPPAGSAAPQQQQQQQPAVPQGFRPLASHSLAVDSNASTGPMPTGVDPAAGSAQTTTVAQHEERPVPGLTAPRPFDGLPPLPTAGGGRPLPQQGGVGANLSVAATSASPSPADPHYYSSLSGAAASRPLDPAGQMRYVAADSTNSLAAGVSMAGRTPNVAGSPAMRMHEGPRPKGRGMMVELPGTQAVNRNIAPNASAVWKEWVDTEGIRFFFHEPTNTLQRLLPGATEPETLVQGSADIPEADLAEHPSIRPSDTVVDLNTQTVRNLQSYGEGGEPGHAGVDRVRSPGVYRTEAVPSQPRGGYSPSRRAPMEALTAPRMENSGYQGKRLHRLSLRPGEDLGQAVVTHQVQTLDADNMNWNRQTGTITSRDPAKQGPVGSATLHRQWEHVRKLLCQGRYFKKHALRSNQEAFRFVFLTGDNSYVCCVPTSQVMLNVGKDPKTFGTASDTIQYYGPETRAMSVNSITHVVVGTEEPMVYRRRSLTPENTVIIVGKTHALILECNTADEAQFWCDSWNFFLEYSRPVNPKSVRTPQMTAPVTYGTRTGVAF